MLGFPLFAPYIQMLALSCCIGVAITSYGRAQSVGTAWSAADALGRTVANSGTTKTIRTDRTVGIFYFLHHNRSGQRVARGTGPYDITKIVAQDPDILSKQDSPLWGGNGVYHYWGEPLFGYYRTTDSWVIRRHALLLADAGIDVLIFDTTNAVIYAEAYRAVCKVFTKIRSEGGRTPQVTFMLNTRAGSTAQRIYADLYKPGDYRDLWFLWEGKPLMICDPNEVEETLREFFTFRKAHWPFEMKNTRNAWHWEATYPQPFGYTTDPNVAEMVNVSVAQNLRRVDGRVTNMSDGNARGRSFWKYKVNPELATDWGRNFEEQWQRAYELDPPFVMVTGWNEWIAQRLKRGDQYVFIDQFDREHSRDIEPMTGGHGDNYYLQLVDGVRKYAGTPAFPKATAFKTIRLDESFLQWRDVGPELRDHTGETDPRDYGGVSGTHYANTSGRNDIVRSKVARDKAHIFFYLQTRTPIQPSSKLDKLWLLIDVGGDLTNGWIGGDFLIGREADDHTALLEVNTSGWNWKQQGRVAYRIEGNELQLAVPLVLLDIETGSDPLETISFKWIDNAQNPGDPLDLYQSGDVAPESRFLYHVEP